MSDARVEFDGHAVSVGDGYTPPGHVRCVECGEAVWRSDASLALVLHVDESCLDVEVYWCSACADEFAELLEGDESLRAEAVAMMGFALWSAAPRVGVSLPLSDAIQIVRSSLPPSVVVGGAE